MGACRELLRPSVPQADIAQFEPLEELVRKVFGSCCLLNTLRGVGCIGLKRKIRKDPILVRLWGLGCILVPNICCNLCLEHCSIF